MNQKNWAWKWRSEISRRKLRKRKEEEEEKNDPNRMVFLHFCLLFVCLCTAKGICLFFLLACVALCVLPLTFSTIFGRIAKWLRAKTNTKTQNARKNQILTVFYWEKRSTKQTAKRTTRTEKKTQYMLYGIFIAIYKNRAHTLNVHITILCF